MSHKGKKSKKILNFFVEKVQNFKIYIQFFAILLVLNIKA